MATSLSASLSHFEPVACIRSAACRGAIVAGHWPAHEARCRADGVLTQEEFDAEKQKILEGG